ncbi:MAG: hypothetical protein PVJ28_00180 [Acidimicrobiia bacterium]
MKTLRTAAVPAPAPRWIERFRSAREAVLLVAARPFRPAARARTSRRALTVGWSASFVTAAFMVATVAGFVALGAVLLLAELRVEDAA